MIDPCSLEPKRLLTLDEALAIIKSSIQPLCATESLSLNDALGRVLADDLLSPINIPYDRNSAMDGYAFSSQDIKVNQPVTLTLAGTSWAGKPYKDVLKSGQCVRIFTGAVIPDGADSVVIQEQVSVEGGKITLPLNVATKQNIRKAGEDIAKCGLLCPKRKQLSPTDVGLIAAAGIHEICVYRQVNIAFFTTGDELIALDQAPEAGKIYDSNRYTLAGMMADACHTVTDLGIIQDDKKSLEETIKAAAKSHDMIISTGGASVGDADYIQEVLAECGEVSFWKIAIKPGKPLAFGKIGGCYFFGLPGNPVSAAVTFEQVVTPALRVLSGASPCKRLRLKAICATNLKKSPGRQEFQRGILSQDENGNLNVTATGPQGSHILSSMSKANCYIVLPADSKGASPGDLVEVEPFDIFI